MPYATAVGRPVLHVARLTDRSGRYYLADLARELGPPSRDPGSPAPRGPGTRGEQVLVPGRPGRWTGAAAAGLGLEGAVAAGDLEAVLDGRVPGTGRPLVRRQGGVAGYDCTFTAPKSASVLFALGGPAVSREVVAAHDESVAAAMDYVARRAAAVRVGTGEERVPAPVSGVVGAAFTHGVSRALDPHLHTHVVVANLGHGPDGRWAAIDGRGLYAHATAAGHLYDAHLRRALGERLGVRWTARPGGRYEVEGLGPEVLGTFSTRRAEIREHLAAVAGAAGARAPGARALGARPSARAARVAWAATRDAKDPAVGPEGLARRWADRAAGCGLDRAAMAATVGRAPPSPPTVDEYRFGAVLSQAPDAGVARRDAVAAWAGALDAGAGAAEVEQCCDRLVPWGDGVGVAEGRRGPASAAAAPHLLAALGPRPGDPRRLGVWMDAADAVTRYRSRWGVTDRSRALGVEGSGRHLSGLDARRLADHLSAARAVADARRALGRARVAEPPERVLGRA